MLNSQARLAVDTFYHVTDPTPQTGVEAKFSPVNFAAWTTIPVVYEHALPIWVHKYDHLRNARRFEMRAILSEDYNGVLNGHRKYF